MTEEHLLSDAAEIRAALLQASEDLLEGRLPGPLTGVRLAEAAGVKRHRLTHDNRDIRLFTVEGVVAV